MLAELRRCASFLLCPLVHTKRAVAKYAALCLGGAGECNAEHYFVATQDRALRVALGQQPGGASIFCSVNGVHLEQPSETQKAQLGQARTLDLIL